MAKRADIDWGKVEREYRAGTLSVREIGRRNGAHENQIRRRASAEGWERDLANQVRARVRTEVVRSLVRNPDAQDSAAIVTEAAGVQLGVQQTHRRDVTALRAQCATLTEELSGSDLKLSERSGIVRDLAQALGKLVQLERQAYGIDDRADNHSEVAREAEGAAARVDSKLDRLQSRAAAGVGRDLPRHANGRATHH